MHRLRFVITLIPALSLVVLTGCSGQESPTDDAPATSEAGSASEASAFTAMSFDTAIAANQTSGDLLLVDATASWCKPCKRMEREAWSNPEIVAWIEERGTAIQFDVDEQEDLKTKLRIQGMPTVVAFRNGKEIGRKVGYRSLEDFRMWLASLG